jgi:hypothetical protein
MASKKSAATAIDASATPTVWERFDAAALHAESKDTEALVNALKAMAELLNTRLAAIEHSIAALAKTK